MIYLKCPTCGYILGNRQYIYEKGLEEIESNPNNDEQIKGCCAFYNYLLASVLL